MRSILAEAEGSIRSLASQTPPHNGDSELCFSPGPLEGPPLAKAGPDLRHGAQKEGCLDRCFLQVKSSHLYLYSAFNNANCVKATAQYQNRKIVNH